MSALDPETRYPIDRVLPGLEVHPLPEGWTPLEALALVKCLDAEGESTWAFRTTPGLNKEELLGSLVVHSDLLRRSLIKEWDDDDD